MEKYNYRIENHTLSSQKIIGTYVEGEITQDEIESRIKGSWGGKWIKFENGQFEYISHTGD